MASKTHATDYYHDLGLGRSASQRDIKVAYMKLAKQHHPDKNVGAPSDSVDAAEFRKVQAAYETLRDPDKRARYDRLTQAASETRPRPAGRGQTTKRQKKKKKAAGPSSSSSTSNNRHAHAHAHAQGAAGAAPGPSSGRGHYYFYTPAHGPYDAERQREHRRAAAHAFEQPSFFPYDASDDWLADDEAEDRGPATATPPPPPPRSRGRRSFFTYEPMDAWFADDEGETRGPAAAAPPPRTRAQREAARAARRREWRARRTAEAAAAAAEAADGAREAMGREREREFLEELEEVFRRAGL